MNNQATLEKLQVMKLFGMHRAFKVILDGTNGTLTIDEAVGHLTDSEWDERYNRKLDRYVKAAKFRYQASLENLDFSANRNLDKNEITRLATCDWIKKGQSMIITGPTGAGKSFLACMFGYQACQMGIRMLYLNCLKLFSALKYAQADGSYQREVRKLQKLDLIILDDFGLQTLDQNSRISLLEILEDRHDKRSVIITSQMPSDKWHEIIGDPTIADAICDRLVHKAHKINLQGESMRKQFRK